MAVPTHQRSRNPGLVDPNLIPGFIATTVSGLTLWLKADAITGVANNAALSSWPDSSGVGNTCIQGTAGLKPIYKTSQINGLPIVAFDGSDDGMLTSLSVSLPFTLIAVYKPTSISAGSNRRLLSGSNNWLLGPYAANHQCYNGAFINAGAATSGTTVVLAVTEQTGLTSLYLNNGTAVTNTNSGVPGTLGLGASGAFTEPAGSDIAEVMAYNKVLTSTEMLTVYRYLKSKYGL